MKKLFLLDDAEITDPRPGSLPSFDSHLKFLYDEKGFFCVGDQDLNCTYVHVCWLFQ